MEKIIEQAIANNDNWDKFHSMPKASYYWANNVTQFKRNYIKYQAIDTNVIDKAKQCYPKDSNIASNFNPITTENCNLFILKSYITNTIVKYQLITNAKDIKRIVNNQGTKVIRWAIRKAFVIPEMNVTFTTNQIKQLL